ncbi:hypothetical protein O6H91_11G114500 [Diphasiastrum complanatum]|uniref:Uncharacterized protein n=1 Tax=Diphasiastrum complanatum TaxID=34168 RepID=A0ACC2CCZ4_DIPCM|nr:hypothetical protein O6H91_11G114500 [Diphasiastrum complanatum]
MEGAKKIAIAATVGNLLQGWDNGAIAGALLYLKPEFGLENNPGLEGVVVASTLVGAWLSTLCSGPAADFLGRRLVLCISALLYSISAATMLWSPNVYVLIASRLLVGTGIGLCVTVIPIYISESAPAEIRGQLSTLPQLMGSGGLFGVYMMVFTLSLTAHPNWRYMLGVLIVPSLLFLGLTIFYLPESPRWLVSKGRMREAKLVLQHLRDKNDVTAELALLVEGLGVGAETALEEWLLEPAELVTEVNYRMTEGNKTSYKYDDGISWIGTPTLDESGHHGLLSRRASVEPGGLSLMDPMVSLMGSLRSSVLGGFEDKDEESDEEGNPKKILSSCYLSDEDPVLDSDDNPTTPLLSKSSVRKVDLPSSFKSDTKDAVQIRSGTKQVKTPVASYQDHPSIASWRYSNGKFDSPPLVRVNSRTDKPQDSQTIGSVHYSSLPRSTMPIGSIPASIGSVGIGGGWQLAWVRTEADAQETNRENGGIRRVFLLQDGPVPSRAASALSLLSGIEAEQFPAAALVAQPVQISKDILKVNPLGPAMVHPSQTAVKGPAWRDLWEGGVQRALIVGVGLQILQQFSGINAVLYFVPQILQQSGAQILLADMGVGANSASILASGVTCLLMLPCIILAMRLMDQAGRRQMLLATLPILFFSLVGMVIAFFLLPTGLLQAAASFIGVSLYVCTFVMGFGPIPNILGAEIFPTRVRGVCIGICQATMWTCNIIMTNLFPILLLELGIAGVFGIFAIMSLVSWVFVFLKVPETKGMPLEVISEFFAMSVTVTTKSAIT